MKARLLKVAFFAAVAAAVLACAADQGPTEPGTIGAAAARGGIPNVGVGLSANTAKLLYCNPRPEVVSRERIGPDGGTIWAGIHRLKVPAGSLSRPTMITMTAPSDTAATVTFQPEGLRFKAGLPATLTMSLNGCATPPVKNVGIVYVDDLFTILEKLTTKWNGNSGTLQAELGHFSRYAVAW